jgi:hypothetical protein
LGRRLPWIEPNSVLVAWNIPHGLHREPSWKYEVQYHTEDWISIGACGTPPAPCFRVEDDFPVRSPGRQTMEYADKWRHICRVRVSGLKTGDKYFLRVRAKDREGRAGAWSSIASGESRGMLGWGNLAVTVD